MEQDWLVFKQLFISSIGDIPDGYFNRIGRYDPSQPIPDVFRERAYCYELYHHLRRYVENNLSNYTLHGEIDKHGHNYINDIFRSHYLPARRMRNPNYFYVNHDFVVHIPGSSVNLVVIEVKSLDFDADEAQKDIDKLDIFTRDDLGIQYRHGILLIFGQGNRSVRLNLRGNNKISVLWHNAPGSLPVPLQGSEDWSIQP